MQTLRPFRTVAAFLLAAGMFPACQNGGLRQNDALPAAMRDAAAVRLNYRYEADVPAPTADPNQPVSEERNAAVQADFDATRQFELLDRTYSSPDKKWVVAIYHRLPDLPDDHRLDMYTRDGKLVKKLTSDVMAVRFPDTLRWSPDSSNLAFLAAFRRPSLEPSPSPSVGSVEPTPSDSNSENVKAETPSAPTPLAPTGILTFRSEQIYISTADGASIRPVTQTDGLKYYYFAWSPDSSMLAAMATTEYEWSLMRAQAEGRGEQLIPKGRPRVIEKNGRERRLDDNITDVWPVWSPDSTKVATAFGTQVRIYDATAINATQAAIPLRNQMLISAKAYEEKLAREANANTDPNVNGDTNNAAPPQATPELSTLPEESSLVSYNPIVELVWSADDLLYLKTAYVRRMLNVSDNAVSFLRWHRLVLSAQPIPTAR